MPENQPDPKIRRDPEHRARSQSVCLCSKVAGLVETPYALLRREQPNQARGGAIKGADEHPEHRS